MPLNNSCPEIAVKVGFKKLFGIDVDFDQDRPGLADEQISLPDVLLRIPANDLLEGARKIVKGGELQAILAGLDRTTPYIVRSGGGGAGHFHVLEFMIERQRKVTRPQLKT